jgi:hypothetical protein
MSVDIKRLRSAGLRVVCAVCGLEHRHRFERRLRDKRSSCCGARMLPRWHLGRENGRFRSPKLAARAFALREREISRLRPI